MNIIDQLKEHIPDGVSNMINTHIKPILSTQATDTKEVEDRKEDLKDSNMIDQDNIRPILNAKQKDIINHIKTISKANKGAVVTIFLTGLLCTLSCILFNGGFWFTCSMLIINLIITISVFALWALMKTIPKPKNEKTELKADNTEESDKSQKLNLVDLGLSVFVFIIMKSNAGVLLCTMLVGLLCTLSCVIIKGEFFYM
ncbi:MAG: hypothetical protein ACI31C_08855, partial [Muribaculaceae bacterium]